MTYFLADTDNVTSEEEPEAAAAVTAAAVTAVSC